MNIIFFAVFMCSYEGIYCSCNQLVVADAIYCSLVPWCIFCVFSDIFVSFLMMLSYSI